MTISVLAVLINVLNGLGLVLTAVVFMWVLSTWLLDQFHPVRVALERIIAPFLTPIRNIMPASGPVDFSPLLLILGIQLLVGLLQRLLGLLR